MGGRGPRREGRLSVQCPGCCGGESRVTDSRTVDGAIRRRRACLDCGARFTTFERVGVSGVFVIKRDGRREEFSREKLLAGLRQACVKRPIESAALQAAVDRIAAAVQALGQPEVASARLGELAMNTLRELDAIAYVRFACIYRAFADLGALQIVIDELRGATGKTSEPLLPFRTESPDAVAASGDLALERVGAI
jgi:transcriptional repressor NrdR